MFDGANENMGKKKKIDESQITQLDIVESCFFLLRSNTNFYRNKWNWSIFFEKYLNFGDNRIKW